MLQTNTTEVGLSRALISLASVAGLVLLVPFAILLVGLPIVFAVRALLEISLWLFPAIR